MEAISDVLDEATGVKASIPMECTDSFYGSTLYCGNGELKGGRGFARPTFRSNPLLFIRVEKQENIRQQKPLWQHVLPSPKSIAGGGDLQGGRDYGSIFRLNPLPVCFE